MKRAAQPPDALPSATAPHDTDADAALVQASRRGTLYSRHQAFSVLVVRYERLIRSLLRSLGATGAEAEEITQEAYIMAWRKLADLQQAERFLPWLKQIAYRQFLREIRRPTETALVAAAEVGIEESPWIDHDLLTMMSTCTRDEQELLILCHAFEFSISEIAESRGTASGTIKSKLHRARQKIKTAMADTGKGEISNG